MNAARETPIQVLLAGRSGILRGLLTPVARELGVEIHEAPSDHAGLTEAIARLQPEVVIIELRGAELAGGCEQLVSDHPDLIVLTVSKDEQYMHLHDRFVLGSPREVVKRIRELVAARLGH